MDSEPKRVKFRRVWRSLVLAFFVPTSVEETKNKNKKLYEESDRYFKFITWTIATGAVYYAQRKSGSISLAIIYFASVLYITMNVIGYCKVILNSVRLTHTKTEVIVYWLFWLILYFFLMSSFGIPALVKMVVASRN